MLTRGVVLAAAGADFAAGGAVFVGPGVFAAGADFAGGGTVFVGAGVFASDGLLVVVVAMALERGLLVVVVAMAVERTSDLFGLTSCPISGTGSGAIFA